MIGFRAGVLLTLAFLLTFVVIGLSPWILASWIGVVAVVLGETEPNAKGFILGQALVYALLVGGMLFCWWRAMAILKKTKI